MLVACQFKPIAINQCNINGYMTDIDINDVDKVNFAFGYNCGYYWRCKDEVGAPQSLNFNDCPDLISDL
jgi:hypothetical protein